MLKCFILEVLRLDLPKARDIFLLLSLQLGIFLPAQVSEKHLHCVVVWFWQLLDQVSDVIHTLLVVGAL